MKFWKVALAIVMYRTLELLWTYAFGLMDGDFQVEYLLTLTFFWFVLSAAVWAAMRAIAEAVARDRAGNGDT